MGYSIAEKASSRDDLGRADLDSHPSSPLDVRRNGYLAAVRGLVCPFAGDIVPVCEITWMKAASCLCLQLAQNAITLIDRHFRTNLISTVWFSLLHRQELADNMSGGDGGSLLGWFLSFRAFRMPQVRTFFLLLGRDSCRRLTGRYGIAPHRVLESGG